MKNHTPLLVILIVAACPIPAAADNPPAGSALNIVAVRDYQSLAAAITAIGSTETDLHVTDRQIISTAVIVPGNINLVIPKGGQLIKADGGSITFAEGSKLQTGIYQIFTGFDSGVTFNAGSVAEVYPEWWGAKPDGDRDGRTDSQPAFKAAHDSFDRQGGTNRGGKINIANGDYYLARTWEITKLLTIEGRQSAHHVQSSVSRLMFPPNTTGLRVRTGYSTIRDLTVHAMSKDNTGHGIHASGAIYVQRVNVQYFAENGFNIVASASKGTGNANLWSMTDCSALNNGGHGLFVSGADTNAGVCSKFNGTWNDGWQIYDDSLLGNTYIQCHTASASRKSYKARSRANVFVGCYAEMGQNTDLAPGILVLGGVMSSQDDYPFVSFDGDGHGAKGMVVSTGPKGAITGILMTSYGAGYTKAKANIYPPSGAGAVLTPVITDGRITSVRIENGGTGYIARTGTANIVPDAAGFRTNRVRVTNRAAGSDRAADIVLADRANALLTVTVADSSPSTIDVLAWNQNAGAFESRHPELPASAGIRYVTDISTTETGGRNTPLPAGSIEFPNGLWIGGGPIARHQNIAAAAPVDGEHARGDIVWNVAPSAGGHVGWVCTEPGTPGTWKPFGAIEP
ncbi:MAG: hypothetical protein CMJ49_12270 [Planctomycetaceae bacterium]|nr:hypothetical protein [Planctomycetaceae bacterium]